MLPHYIISVLVIEKSAPVCAGVPTARELYISLSLHIAVLSASPYLNPNLTSSGTLPRASSTFDCGRGSSATVCIVLILTS
jgi:hypothetical protein